MLNTAGTILRRTAGTAVSTAIMNEPRAALTAGALADTYLGGIDVMQGNEKTCSDCGQVKAMEEFHGRLFRRRGGEYLWTAPRCKQCHLLSRKGGERQRYLKRKAVLDAYKQLAGCTDCGTKDGPLDFDHRPGTEKLFGVGMRWSLGWEKLWAEIAKCDVRCRSCHSARHARLGETAGIAEKRAKTHCAQGHPYTPENTYIRPSGGRGCRVCNTKTFRKKKRLGLP